MREHRHPQNKEEINQIQYYCSLQQGYKHRTKFQLHPSVLLILMSRCSWYSALLSTALIKLVNQY